MNHTLNELLDVIYRHYPRGLLPLHRGYVRSDEVCYFETEECRRLLEAGDRGRVEYPTWEAMIHRIGDRFRLQNESLNLMRGGRAPAYSARIYRPKDLELRGKASLSFHVSLLGPYYGIHDRGEPDETSAAIAAEIEATYPGYQQIPPELGNEIVPDVAADWVLMGEATIYTCLFSDVWTWVDPPKASASVQSGLSLMRHSLEQLLDIIYQYYPRGAGIPDSIDAQDRWKATEEHARLVAARKKAATDERWRALQRRIGERFPDASITNYSYHLPTGEHDGCYSFVVFPPDAGDRQPARQVWFHISFLAPYYVVHSLRMVESAIAARVRALMIMFHGVPFHLVRSAATPELVVDLSEEEMTTTTIHERDQTVTFDLSPDAQPNAAWIAREIEATFGCERMPPEVGTARVPGVTLRAWPPGEARIFECLFTDHHEWVRPPRPEGTRPREADVEIAAHRLTDRFIPVLTVLAAIQQIAFAVLIEPRGAFCWEARTDGVLHKEEVLAVLASIRPRIESPVTKRGIADAHKIGAATRRLEALIAAWDGEGAPPSAMVAWAESFLGDWVPVLRFSS